MNLLTIQTAHTIDFAVHLEDRATRPQAGTPAKKAKQRPEVFGVEVATWLTRECRGVQQRIHCVEYQPGHRLGDARRVVAASTTL